MGTYILKRLFLIIPTLFLILCINFAVIQIAPGGPVERAIQQAESFQRLQAIKTGIAPEGSNYQGAKGLSEDMLRQIEAQYGFDQPAYIRFGVMLKNYLSFDFGISFFKDKPVTQLIW